MARRANPLHPKASALAAFGAELRYRRENYDGRGLTLEELSKIAGYSAPYFSTVERAKEMPSREFVVDVDQALKAAGALVRQWDNTLDTPFPEWFDWHLVEAQADALRTFQATVFDGLTQTEQYANVILDGDKKAVEGRMSRKAIFNKPDRPTLTCIIAEAILTFDVGGKEVMYAQLRHLAELAEDAETHLHVVPHRMHRGTSGSFVIATLPDRSEVAYTQTALRGITTAEPADLRSLYSRFESLRSAALPADQSLELILRTAEERWT